jgi:hypothetical protein
MPCRSVPRESQWVASESPTIRPEPVFGLRAAVRAILQEVTGRPKKKR